MLRRHISSNFTLFLIRLSIAVKKVSNVKFFSNTDFNRKFCVFKCLRKNQYRNNTIMKTRGKIMANHNY